MPTIAGVRARLSRRRRNVLVHRVSPPPAGFVPDRQPSGGDVTNAERLLAAYRASPPGDRDADIWTAIATHQRRYLDVLDRGRPDELAAYLCNMARHDATRGTVQGDAEHRRLARDPLYRRHVARMAADKLLLLAEAVGAVPIENPEQGAWGRNRRLPLDRLVNCVSEAVGVDITPPDTDGGLFKIEAGDGRIGERDCNAIYTGWLLREFGSVCEIGGGSGRVAYWASRFGVDGYTLIDLPHINVVQGFYLMSTLGGDAVTLYGEDRAAPVSVVPDTAYRSVLDGRRFDVVLNQDSFPEIAEAVVRGYLDWIGTVGAPLLSINHESRPSGQVRVSDLAVAGWRRQSRDLYWLRRGYVTEHYVPTGDTHRTRPML